MKNLMIALLIAAGVFGVWYWWTHRTTVATTATSGSGTVGSSISYDGSVSGNGVTITADDGTATPVLPSDTNWSPSTGVINKTIVEAPSTSAQAATVNGTFQTVITPDVYTAGITQVPNAGNGSGTETIYTGGLGTDQPYQIINGQVVLI